MAKADWYCRDCDTHGGKATIEEHIAHAHEDGMARVIEGTYRDWNRKYGLDVGGR